MKGIENPSLYEKLEELTHTDYYPFHMPGHKRNGRKYPLEELYKIDISEIDEFDNLHEPEDIIEECMNKISALYESDKSYLLVNGSTCGVLSAISASVPRGGKLLLARNSHKSAYHAIFLNDLEVQYLYPEYIEAYDLLGRILPEQVETALRRGTDIKAVFITSPTYDGMISDVEKIVDICHMYGVICIIDEAHGAHLGLFEDGRKNAIQMGADIVIHSVHKTLPALTQTALLHVRGKRVEKELLEYYLKIYQSSSPSYILMVGIEECFRIIKQQGTGLFNEFQKNKEQFYLKTKDVKNIRILTDRNDIYDMDAMKIVISVKNLSISGKQLYEHLRNRYHLQMEMYSNSYVLALITIMDTAEGFVRLAEAVIKLDEEVCKIQSKGQIRQDRYKRESPVAVQTIYAAQMQKKGVVSLDQAKGRVSGAFLNLYPPGIPLVVPGEVFTEELVEMLHYFCDFDYKIQGMDKTLKKLVVVKDERYVKM